jgi:hypothetical protein
LRLVRDDTESTVYVFLKGDTIKLRRVPESLYYQVTSGNARDGRANSPGYGNNVEDWVSAQPSPTRGCEENDEIYPRMDAVHRLNGGGVKTFNSFNLKI